MDPDAGELTRRADEIAASGDWEELRAFLEGVERDLVLSRNALAYRFGEALYHTARFDELERFSHEYEERARSASDVSGLLQALNLRFIPAFETGRLDDAWRRAQDLLELASAEGEEEMQAKSAHNVALVYSLRGSWEEALSYFQLALPLYERLGVTRGVAQVHQNLGNVYRYLERLDEATDAHRVAERLARRIGYTFGVAMATVGRAEVELLRGEVEFARQLVEKGLQRARSAGDPLTEADGLRVLALVDLESGHVRRALAHLDDAADLAGRAESRVLEGEVHRDRARVLAAGGETGRAAEEISEAISHFEASGARFDADRARAIRDDL